MHLKEMTVPTAETVFILSYFKTVRTFRIADWLRNERDADVFFNGDDFRGYCYSKTRDERRLESS